MAKVALTTELQKALNTFRATLGAKQKAVAKVTGPPGMPPSHLRAYKRAAARILNNANKKVKDDKKRYHKGELNAKGLYATIMVYLAVVEEVPLSPPQI